MRCRELALLLLLFCLPFAVRARGSLVDLSVYYRTDGRRLPVYWHRVRAYIVGNENSPVREVAYERATPSPVETVTLYYDTYPNLVARGVIPASRPPIAPGPQPFPGALSTFAPDPPG